MRIVTLCLLAHLAASGRPAMESLDRGGIALPTADGVLVSWRLLAADPPDTGFHVVRVDAGGRQRLTGEPLREVTCFHDPQPAAAGTSYEVIPVVAGGEGMAVGVAVEPSAYRSIPLVGDDEFSKVAIADLNGAGVYDFVVKRPAGGIDPGRARPSPGSYRIEAYCGSARKRLWTYDLGWNMNMGVWWTPMVAADLTGDGKSEVVLKTAPFAATYDESLAEKSGPAHGFVIKGPEFLTVLDGASGEVIAQADWVPRGDPTAWGDNRGNRVNRNQLGIACLDGGRFSILAARGTYTRMVVHAWDLVDGTLVRRWVWDGDEDDPPVRGQGAHGMHCVDLDGDGKDEIVLGSVVLDDDGTMLWNNGMGHPDIVYVGEISADNPGLEIAYGYETPQTRNGIHVADALSGRILWGHDRPTSHLHDQGMLADILPEHPGMEFYAAEQDRGRGSFLYAAATGERLGTDWLGTLSPRPLWWVDGPQKVWSPFNYGSRTIDLIRGRAEKIASLPGTIIGLADVVGDWREEMVVSLPGELRLYSTTIPATTRHVSLMQDPLYRSGVTMQAMGYLYPPQLSRLLDFGSGD